MFDYSAPVDQLLRLGDPSEEHRWPDYPRRYGLRAEHIPELIRMATDMRLNLALGDTVEVWAPVHAWRALGQLRAEAAVVPLLQLHRQLQQEQDYGDDWIVEELPRVLGQIGPAALGPIAEVLADPAQPEGTRCVAASALGEIGKEHPEARAECVALLARQLERAERPDRELNGWALAALLDLGADEAAPVIERAFQAGAVDESIAGDWPQVAWELGLSDEPPEEEFEFLEPPSGFSFRSGMTPKQRAKARAKRKQAAKSRQRNRKKKKK
jgi:hypothetical protein